VKKTTTRKDKGPYKNNWDHIEDEIRWLAARARRIAAERNVGNWLQEADVLDAQRDSVPKVCGLRDLETRLRKTIDIRLASTRGLSPSLPLGLDQVAGQAASNGFPLSEDEKLLVIVAAVPGLSRHIAGPVFDPLGVHSWGRLAVEDALLMLDPQSPGDWVRLRKYIRPSAALLRSGILTLVVPSGQAGPDRLMDATVGLSLEAFGVLTGDADAVQEDQGED
jgi:hypothetical protein